MLYKNVNILFKNISKHKNFLLNFRPLVIILNLFICQLLFWFDRIFQTQFILMILFIYYSHCE